MLQLHQCPLQKVDHLPPHPWSWGQHWFLLALPALLSPLALPVGPGEDQEYLEYLTVQQGREAQAAGQLQVWAASQLPLLLLLPRRLPLTPVWHPSGQVQAGGASSRRPHHAAG